MIPMENSKLIGLLRTFDTREIRLLSEFIRSPYYNKNRNVVAFFELVRKHHPSFRSPRLDPEWIHQAIFGRRRFRDVKIRELLSQTLVLAEMFLATENRKKQGGSDVPFLLQELNSRNQDTLFEISDRKKKNVHNGQVQDRFFFLDRYLVTDAVNTFQWKRNDNKKEKLAGSGMFEKALRELTEFYAYEGMRILIRMTILQYGIQYPASRMEEGEKILQLARNLDQPPEIFRFLHLFQRVATKNDDKAYKELKELFLSDVKPRLSRADTLTGFDLLLIYCFSRSAKGSKDLLKDTFLLLKRFTELGLHLENGFIEDAYFINMVIVALKNGEPAWARKYVEEQQHLLPAESRSDVVNYCLGSIAEVEKKSREALHHLGQVRNPGLLVNLNIKAMLIKIYYSRDDMKQVMQTCRGLMKFLGRNNKLSAFQKQLWMTFAGHTHTLARINMGLSKIDMGALVKEIEKGEMIVKGWVLKNAKELQEKSGKQKDTRRVPARRK